MDDPLKYLFFVSDGTVVPRAGLDEKALRRAKETMRVFALDKGALVQMRKAQLAGPLGAIEEVQACGFEPETASELIQGLAALYENQPFSSAVLDLLGVTP